MLTSAYVFSVLFGLSFCFEEVLNKIRASKIFLKHHDVLVPLTPLHWGNLLGTQKMLVGVQFKGELDPVELGKVGKESVYLMDKRGLMQYHRELVQSFEQEALNTTSQKALLEHQLRISRFIGVQELGSLYDRIVVAKGARQSDLDLLPHKYWTSLTRAQLGDIIRKASLGPVLNKLYALGLREYAQAMVFKRNGPATSLVTVKSSDQVEQSVFTIPGVLNIATWDEKVFKVAADKIFLNTPPLNLLLELESEIVQEKILHYYEPEANLNDKKDRLMAWRAVIQRCPSFDVLPTKVRGKKSLANAFMTGKNITESFMSALVGLNKGQELVTQFLKHLQANKGDLVVLNFVAHVGKEIPILDLDISKFNHEHWTLVAKLVQGDSLADLIVTGFLLGHIGLGNKPPFRISNSDWRQFKAAKTLEKKLQSSVIRDHVHLLANSLLWVINSNPVGVKLPDSLLSAIYQSEKLDGSYKTALLTHAYRQDGRRPWLDEKTATKTLVSIKNDSQFSRLLVEKLKLFLSAGQPDVMTFLLQDKERLLVQAKSQRGQEHLQTSEVILMEIIELVLGDKYDPDDLGLLVALLEVNLPSIDVKKLKAMQRKLLVIDATETNRLPDPSAMHLLVQLIQCKDADDTTTLTLEELSRDFLASFGGAKFIQPKENSVLELSAAEALESFIWQTAGNEDACAAIVHIISYYYAAREWSEEVLSSVNWVIKHVPLGYLFNLLGRVYHRTDLIESILGQLQEMGFEVAIEAAKSLNPLEATLETIEHRDARNSHEGFKRLLVSYQESYLYKSNWFILDAAPFIDRILKLDRTDYDFTSLHTIWTKAFDMTGSYDLSFKLLPLVEIFNNTPMTVLLEILSGPADKSFLKAFEIVKNSILDP